MSQLKKGALLSYVTIILTNGVGLLLTPFMIRTLGDSEYGLYMLVGAIISYISVLDFGLTNTIVRYIARYRATQDRPGEENFLATTMILYGVISALVALAGIAIYFNLETIFPKLTPIELEKARVMFVILIFNLAITLPGGAFSAICSGYEHFVFPRSVNIVRYIVRSLMLVAVLLLGGDSVSVVWLDTAVNLLVIGLNGYYVFKKLGIRFKLHQWETPLVREIFSYSIWIFVFAMVGHFQWRAGQVILGSTSGSVAVAIYATGITLGTYYGAFSTAISGVFLPRATKMTVLEASSGELTDMMIRIGRFSLMMLLLILGGFFLYGQQFVQLWLKNAIYEQSWLIALIIMVSYTVPLVQAFANSILEARRKFAFKAVTYITLIVLGTVVGAWLIPHYGMIGLVAGSTGGWVLSQIVMNFYYARVIDLQIGRFVKELCAGLLPSFLVTVAIGYGIDFLPGEGWVNLCLKIFSFICIFIVLMGRFGLNASERQTIGSMVPTFLRKRWHGHN